MDRPRKARFVWNAVERIGEKNVVDGVAYCLCDIVGVSLDKRAVRRTPAFGNPHLRHASSSAASISMVMTLRAILESGNVNQPSPEHRSTTSIPGVTPTSLSTLAGSGHSASHHPGSGIPVPSKKPDCLSVTRSTLSEDGSAVLLKDCVDPSSCDSCIK